jgi:hypothetical protein
MPFVHFCILSFSCVSPLFQSIDSIKDTKPRVISITHQSIDRSIDINIQQGICIFTPITRKRAEGIAKMTSTPISMDLRVLWEKKVITKDTYEWLKPLYERELVDMEEIRRAAEERKSNPFYQQNCDEEYEEDNDDGDGDGDDLWTFGITELVGIEATSTTVRIVTDTNSTGHGNKVWHASIATCRYLNSIFLPALLLSSAASNKSSRFRCLELGAGTAVPSLFLGQLLSLLLLKNDNNDDDDDNNNHPTESILRITDAKQYRNIMQILRSVEIQESLRNGRSCMDGDGNESSSNDTGDNDKITNTTTAAALQLEVHPHNWGGPVDGIGLGQQQQQQQQQQHDLVIVSDCIYDPNYHDDLLVSLSRTLALDGTAVVSFSLHGNVQDAVIWEFFERKLPSTTTRNRTQEDGAAVWRLAASCVSSSSSSSDGVVIRDGWNMKETMSELGMVTEGIVPDRWLAYVYEITWVPDEDEDVS